MWLTARSLDVMRPLSYSSVVCKVDCKCLQGMKVSILRGSSDMLQRESVGGAARLPGGASRLYFAPETKSQLVSDKPWQLVCCSRGSCLRQSQYGVTE